MRKKIVPRDGPPGEPAMKGSGLDVASLATVLATSESESHPLEHAFDGRDGPGGTQWVAGETGDQTITLEFDTPQRIQRVTIEIEETEVDRTQEIELAVSADGGGSYHSLLRQEYTFSPTGSTFQRESWRLPEGSISHLRLWIRPDRSGKSAPARLTSLRIE